MFVIFFISALAETNRPPFDLPEAEAELVAGYQTEYSGMMYAMFWLGEYANILLMCAMGSILFLGGWLPIVDIYPINLVPSPIWMMLKILFLFFLFALIKAIVPRYRYDQLMKLGWKIFLPFSLVYLVLTASFLFYSAHVLLGSGFLIAFSYVGMGSNGGGTGFLKLAAPKSGTEFLNISFS